MNAETQATAKAIATGVAVVAVSLVVASALFDRQSQEPADDTAVRTTPRPALTEEERAYEDYLRGFSGGCSELSFGLERSACDPVPRNQWLESWRERRRAAMEDDVVDQQAITEPAGEGSRTEIREQPKPKRPKRRPARNPEPDTESTPFDDPIGDWPFLD